MKNGQREMKYDAACEEFLVFNSLFGRGSCLVVTAPGPDHLPEGEGVPAG
jgi:hypothetical protein